MDWSAAHCGNGRFASSLIFTAVCHPQLVALFSAILILWLTKRLNWETVPACLDSSGNMLQAELLLLATEAFVTCQEPICLQSAHRHQISPQSQMTMYPFTHGRVAVRHSAPSAGYWLHYNAKCTLNRAVRFGTEHTGCLLRAAGRGRSEWRNNRHYFIKKNNLITPYT
jgi:hypothetical protein